MEDPFDGITPAKKDEFEDISQIRNITANYVFCPKCGMKNTFEISKTGTSLNYFCMRCSTKLNPYWESYYDGEIAISNCRVCQQLTFKYLKYCISCGSQQRAVVRKRSREISKHFPDIRTDEEEVLGVLDCFTYQSSDCCSCLSLFGYFALILRRVFKNLPKSCFYISLAITCIVTILLIVLWALLWRNLG